MHQPIAQSDAQSLQVDSTQPVQAFAHRYAQNSVLGAVNLSRQERKARRMSALLAAFQDSPELGATEAGRLIGVHRNTIYTYADELVEAGRLRKNGDSWEVV